MNTYDYKDKIIERLKKYNPIVHTNKEKDYNWLTNDKYCSIEIKNNDSLFIDLEDEITISYKNWHTHYYCEDKDDIEEALEKANNILTNKDCILTFYLNNKLLGSGSSLNKDKYTKEDTIEFLASFIKNKELKDLRVKVNYWDKTKDYEINLNN